MADFFKLKENSTSVKKEVIGGLTTFLTMAYIIFVNPDIMSATGMDKGALITATCVAAFFGTFLVGVWANVPLAMAPGMGLNAFFTYTLVLNQGVNWQTALGVVFISGVVFFILTILGIREKIINSIPMALRISVPAGIGLFITFIGFKNMGLVGDHPATLVTLGSFSPSVVLGLIGFILIVLLEVKKVKGSMLIGILVTTVLAIVVNYIHPEYALVNMPKDFRIISTPPSLAPIAFQLDIKSALSLGLVGAIFSFMFVDLFDSIGTIVACSYEADLVEKDGTIRRIDKMLDADAIATVVGSLLGTSTTTTFIESSSGIADGARTGMASVVTSVMFLLALIFTPIIGIVPSFATAPALVLVGVYMFRNIIKVNFQDFRTAVPAFLTIILMPLTYSISNGLTFGFLSYIIINAFTGKVREISLTMWIVGLLSLLNLLSMAL